MNTGGRSLPHDDNDEDLDEDVERDDVVMFLDLDRDCPLGNQCHGICRQQRIGYPN